MLSLGQYIESKNYHGTASFLQTLSDQWVTFVNDNTVLGFLNENYGISTNTIKNSVYKKYFRVRNRKKATGFEELSELDTFHRSKLQEIYQAESDKNVELNIGSLDIPPREEYNETNFLQACIDAALFHQEQAKLCGKKIYVCLSGGLDYEVTALSFKHAGVDFVPFIVDYKGKNSHDGTCLSAAA